MDVFEIPIFVYDAVGGGQLFSKAPRDFREVEMRYNASDFEYMDDIGQFHRIIGQKEYENALKLTNGQAHYFRVENLIKKDVPKPELIRCSICCFTYKSDSECPVCQLCG